MLFNSNSLFKIQILLIGRVMLPVYKDSSERGARLKVENIVFQGKMFLKKNNYKKKERRSG